MKEKRFMLFAYNERRGRKGGLNDLVCVGNGNDIITHINCYREDLEENNKFFRVLYDTIQVYDTKTNSKMPGWPCNLIRKEHGITPAIHVIEWICEMEEKGENENE